MPLRVDTSTPWSSDEFMIAAMRFLLALSGLLIIYIDPSEPDRYVALTYSTLVSYVVYSATLYILALRRSLLLQSVRTIAHWVDVGWYTLLIALSSGTNSVFFGFYFPILVASFRWGFASGLRVTLVSVVLFTTVGFKTAPEPAFELNRFLLRPTFLLVLGYMVAYWGGFEIMLNRRLTLLKDVTALANPRFGVDRTISSIMAQLRAFYDADACLLVQSNKSTAVHQVRRVDRRDPEAAMPAEPIPEGVARILGALPPAQALVYGCEPRIWGWWPRAHDRVYAVAKGERTAGRQDPPKESGTLVTVLDCQSFVTVPLRFYGETISRLYLIAQRRHAFQMSDVDFLLQVSEHITPILDNIRLVDQLASGAAEEERHRIARDLHDSVIQPYIGLQIGLAAIRQKLAAGGAEVASDIERLIEMTSVEVSDLRRYMHELRDGSERAGDLLLAVRRFASKFSEATGIAVHVEVTPNMRVDGRLAAEVFQIVAEGLSNVRRHTNAMRATIGLECGGGQLRLRIEDEGTEGATLASFTPRSITDRAVALGGHARVDPRENGGSVVVVEIPL